MVYRFERWLGKHLFFPPIIKACQLLDWTQYQFARNAYAFAALNFLALDKSFDWFWWLMTLVAVIILASATLSPPEKPEQGSDFVRLIQYGCIVSGFLGYLLVGAVFVPSLVMGVIVLFAEYACLIRTIPPAETKKSLDFAIQL
jgi:hypothetical protein